MKYLIMLFSALFISMLSTSCDNEFSINDDWKDITVIYGLLDPAADTNWVRVQRAYLGSDAASASYNQPDSLYYQDGEITVFLEAYVRGSNGSLGTPVDTIPLDEDKTSRQLNDGTFTTDGFRIYRTTEQVREDTTYRIVVKKTNANHPDASSTTEIVGRQRNNGKEGFRFVLPNPVIASARIFNGRVEWRESNHSRIYEVDLYFFYKEVNRKTGAVEHFEQKLDYATLEGVSAIADGQGKLSILKQPNDFYRLLSSNLPPLPENTLRFYKSITVAVWSGGVDLSKYIEINKPTQGVNANKPEFPDIENGVGLFSSRTEIELDNVSMSPEMESKYYLSQALCDDGFAIVTSGDTCYCVRTPGIGPERVCN